MRRTQWLFIASALVAVLAGFRQLPVLDDLAQAQPGSSSSSSPQAIDKWDRPEPRRGEVLANLKRATVVESRPSAAGYDRDCGTGHACSFGPAWTDDVDTEFGHNGCDQRNDLLRASLTDVQIRPNTNGCVVEAGTLEDPYTGQTLHFEKSRAYEVQVDHLYPLARAWDMGAATWSPEQRQNFAGDPRNLIVADGSANASKSDQGPGEWMPLNRGYACTYAARYLEVAIAYELPLTTADAESLKAAASTCPKSPQPAR